MTEQNKEKLKRFWEWCGFEDIFEGDTGAYYWRAPNGDAGADLPPTDLNNLFKYAVPRAIEKIMAKDGDSSDYAYEILFNKWLRKLQLDMEHPADTLLQTIWQVIV